MRSVLFALSFALAFLFVGSQGPVDLENKDIMAKLDPGSYGLATISAPKDQADADADADSYDQSSEMSDGTIAASAIGSGGILAALVYVLRVWQAYRQIVADGTGFGQCWLDFVLALIRAACLSVRFGGQPGPVIAV